MTSPQDPLSATFAALSDPTRRALLQRLAGGQTSVGALAEPFDLTLPTVSRHLTVLEQAGLISRHKDAQWRLCRLEPEPLRQASAWIDYYRQFWADRFDGLSDLLSTMDPQSNPGAEPKKED